MVGDYDSSNLSAMSLFSVFLDLKDRDCLVVGTTSEALQSAESLINNGARVTMICEDEVPEQDPAKVPALEGLHQKEFRSFHTDDPANFWLVIAATHDSKMNTSIVNSCHASHTFCHDVSNPSNGSYRIATNSEETTAATARANKLAVNELAIESITLPDSSAKKSGFVSLVGAGPGDPELLTLRALRLIKTADVLVYDRLVSQSILDLRRPDAKLLYAGKAKSDHAMPQGSINQLLVDLAEQQFNVVRLKGGDPFIFGRGGEEIETLAQHRTAFQVVPGITAATGCAAFSGIPLTHRDHAQSCVFLTGHLKNGEINLNWQDLTDPTQTIVIYMGLTGLRQICEKLISNGRSPETPAALVERGTTPAQRVHAETLHTLADKVENQDVRAPTLLIIGGVVSLHQSLNWFESKHTDANPLPSPFTGPTTQADHRTE